MKQFVLLLFILSAFSAFAQDYPFARDFVEGSIVFKDSSQKKGQVMWFPHQNEKLKFRETERSNVRMFAADEVIGFTADTFRFVSLYNFKAYAENYALLGKTSTIKHTFGQLLDSGKINIYFVLITGYNALGGAIQTYPNFLFQNTQEKSTPIVAYPFAVRMRDKKYERAKDDLYTLFNAYPEIIEKIKNYRQQDDFFEIVNMVRLANRQ